MRVSNMRRDVAWLGTFAFLLSACGGQDSAPFVPPAEEEPAPPVVRVDWSANSCPDFTAFEVEPHHIGLHTPGTISVFAEDLESDELFFYWSATSGTLRDTTGASSVYRCTELGPQTISVVATDGDGCSKVMNIYVTCHAD